MAAHGETTRRPPPAPEGNIQGWGEVDSGVKQIADAWDNLAPAAAASSAPGYAGSGGGGNQTESTAPADSGGLLCAHSYWWGSVNCCHVNLR